MYKLRDDLAAVLTIDVLTPLVDDPYDFGRIAAANALSDVFAMGATATCALNFLGLDSSLGTDVAEAILTGGRDAASEAGALLVGGHTIDDDEPKYGLAVFGLVHPDRIVRNAGARPGDAVFLTKPIGTGLLSAAYKIGEVDLAGFAPAIASMKELNAAGARAMMGLEVHAATDVTGFGLAGHLHEMLEASGVSIALDWAHLPLLPGAWDLSRDYCRPNRTFSIMDFAEPFVEQGALDDEEFDNRMGVLCDPQTSGGLIVAVAPGSADAFACAFEREQGRPCARIGTIVDTADAKIAFSDAR